MEVKVEFSCDHDIEANQLFDLLSEKKGKIQFNA